MTYPIEEKAKIKSKSREETLTQLAQIYGQAKTIEDFKIKADLAGLPKKFIKQFIWYYRIRSIKKVWLNPILIVEGLFVILGVTVCIGIEIATNAKDSIIIGRCLLASVCGFLGGGLVGFPFVKLFEEWYLGIEQRIWPFEHCD